MTESFEIAPIEGTIEVVETTFKCNKCPFTTKYKTSLKRHQHGHLTDTVLDHDINANNDRPYMCDKCAKRFHSRYGMQVHIRLKHNNQFRFTCGVCHRGFHHLWNFRGHLSTHHNALKWPCQLCGKTFNHKVSLLRHKKHCKSEGKNTTTTDEFSCDTCANSFKTKKNLQDHIRGAHGGRQFICKTCNKSFKWRSSLSYHNKHVKH